MEEYASMETQLLAWHTATHVQAEKNCAMEVVDALTLVLAMAVPVPLLVAVAEAMAPARLKPGACNAA